MPTFSSRTYKLMWDAHSMTGIVIGLALFVLFVTGALLLFRGEIRQWEEPSLRASPGEQASLEAMTGPVLDSLGRGDTPPSYVYLGLPDAGHDNLYVYATGGTVGASHDAWVNPKSGAWVANPNEGAITQTLYYLHFFYQFGLWGLYLSGVIGLFALLAVVTGTTVHFDRLVKDFFQFRPSEKLRVAWADAHKVLGTIGLPFQTMYAFTGAYLGLVGLIALPYASLLFDGSMADFYREAGYYAPTVQVDSVETASPTGTSLDQLAARARNAWPNFDPKTMIVSNMGEPDSRVEVIGRTRGSAFGGTGSLVFHGATGEELLRDPPSEAGALNQAVQSMEALHFAEFGGLALKILFFLLALASSAVILTGNFTWLEVRRTQDRTINTILARLTAGVATGMAPATALLFLSAHWRPSGAISPDGWTDLVFFGSWGLCVLYALVRPNIACVHRALLATGGVLALLIPLANGLATGDWPWVAWAAGRGAVVGVDVGAVLCGLALLGLAGGLDVEAAPPPPTDQDRREEERTSASGRTPEEVLLDTA
ncbi:PepSY-associated TM helix domain-containing protein [Salinibacter altiplanensis]|uniref:PepSY-associated TM helix domain-containing protein n=1 Tax=Salinibacter altiplanensis TaxID=1803181 RepID=UPI000C9ECE69|nr:PepSY-associated TM helix domain-containing protein [Salinibacter altiplanensis]